MKNPIFRRSATRWPATLRWGLHACWSSSSWLSLQSPVPLFFVQKNNVTMTSLTDLGVYGIHVKCTIYIYNVYVYIYVYIWLYMYNYILYIILYIWLQLHISKSVHTKTFDLTCLSPFNTLRGIMAQGLSIVIISKSSWNMSCIPIVSSFPRCLVLYPFGYNSQTNFGGTQELASSVDWIPSFIA